MAHSTWAGQMLLGLCLMVQPLPALTMVLTPDAQEAYSFADFVAEYDRAYKQGSEEWVKREAVFAEKMATLRAQNAKADKKWHASVNRFMDFYPSEFKQLMGYRKHSHSKGVARLALQRRQAASPNASEQAPPAGALDFEGNGTTVEERDWRTYGIENDYDAFIRTLVRDQGMCGSCWAVACAGVMDFYVMRNATRARRLMIGERDERTKAPIGSTQSVVSCTRNERHCGGTGGCEGATLQLAFAQIRSQGQPLAKRYLYTSGTGAQEQCNEPLLGKWSRVFIQGYYQLAKNSFDDLIQACTQQGPVGVSVAADNWSQYGTGIFDGAQNDFTVNHAVVLYGFKTTGADRHYLVKNSWGTSWGEAGFIRLIMNEEDEKHCGWDRDTHMGLACDGDPDVDWVCGSSGILYDSSLPRGVYISKAGKAF